MIPAVGSRWVDHHGEPLTVVDVQGRQVVVQGQGVPLLVDLAAFDMEFRPWRECDGQTDIFGGEA